ncbi:MAG: hypothetical protein II007_04035 [Gammaproteobacteria bacterium]|nr:hypothetical protein [Gammaproteobacteria bacterium]
MVNSSYLVLLGASALVVVAATRWLPTQNLQQRNSGGEGLLLTRVATIEERQAFGREMALAVANVNQQLALQRRFIQQVTREVAGGGQISTTSRRWLDRFASHVGMIDSEYVDDQQWLQQLLERVDEVPVALVVAQAALHSQWGQTPPSRLHHYFPENCSGNCEQLQQPLPSMEAAVAAHLQRLNSHDDYALLRRLRAQIRDAGRQPTAEELLPGLLLVTRHSAGEMTQLRRVMGELDLR